MASVCAILFRRLIGTAAMYKQNLFYFLAIELALYFYVSNENKPTELQRRDTELVSWKKIDIVIISTSLSNYQNTHLSRIGDSALW